MKHLIIIALALFVTSSAFAQLDEKGKQFLDSLGIKYDLNDPDAEFKIKKALKDYYTAKIDSAKKVASNEVTDPYNTEQLASEMRQELQENNDSTSTSFEFMELMPYIVINLDKPDRRYLTEEGFDLPGSINTLVIRGNFSKVPINFNSLFSELEYAPIRELYLTNNREGISEVPNELGSLTSLKKLGLYGNNISQLPASIGGLTQLEELYIDANPIKELPNTIGNLKELKVLGIAKTKISASEKERIQKLLPNCKILLQ